MPTWADERAVGVENESLDFGFADTADTAGVDSSPTIFLKSLRRPVVEPFSLWVLSATSQVHCLEAQYFRS